MDDRIIDDVLALGALTEEFALVNRTTRLADGVTPESDTDHTVMLGILACSVAATYDARLDLGLIAQFALVHDFVEVYAGDTDTFGGMTEERKADKDARESAALVRITKEFGAHLPWVHETIEKYELLDTPEARFVKTMDKIMPKIARYANKKLPYSMQEFKEFCEDQRKSIKESYGKDQDVALAIHEAVAAKVLAMYQTQ